MRRFLPLVGAFLLLLPAGRAHALSPNCQTLLTLNPVSSQYMQKTLDRADAGIAYAQAASDAEDEFLYLLPWAQQIASSWIAVTKAQLRLNLQQQSIYDVSACQRFDAVLLECKMDKVREEMDAALERGAFQGIMRLQALLRFLNERYEHLINGGLDPTYVDPTWGRRQIFDPPAPTWCCPGVPDDPMTPDVRSCIQTATLEECEIDYEGEATGSLDQCLGRGCREPLNIATLPEEEGSMCPYNADYLEAMETGFGCDLDVMGPRSAYAPLLAEMLALQDVTDRVQTFRTQAQALLQVQVDLEGLLDMDSSVPPLPPPRVHKKAYGCMVRSGYCSDVPSTSCSTDAECDEVDSGTCVLHQGACSENLARFCSEDADCDGMGSCLPGPRDQLPRYPARSTFSVNENHLGILARFMELRRFQGFRREFADELKVPSEFPVEKRNERADREVQNPAAYMLRMGIRAKTAILSRLQGQAESEIYPAAADAQMTIAREMAPLREEVKELVVHASQQEGMRSFVVKLAYWLRRTCIDRACNLRLEQILKIAFQDACFPYADGTFLGDSDGNPRWRQCADAADLTGY